MASIKASLTVGSWDCILLLIFSANQKRQQMDRRRFEAAHLKYASLKMATWYPEAISHCSIKFEGKVTDTLKDITPAMFHSFESRYAGMENLMYIV